NSVAAVSYRQAKLDEAADILAVLIEVAPEIPVQTEPLEREEALYALIRNCARSGESWVAIDETGRIVGFLLAEPDQARRHFGDREVVHGVSCAVGDGELVVVVGPSGCGKSTLLRMVAGLEAVSAGSVAIDGRVVNGVEPKDRDIAMVFQNYALYPHMSVYDNMAYGLKIRRMGRAEIRTRVERAAAILQIGGLLDRKPR